MKHTPGPWKVWGDKDNLISAGDNKAMLAEIIQVQNPSKWKRSDREVKANAQLIAAAPDLLEALKEAKNELKELGANDFGALMTIEQAINNAEGE